MDELTTRKLIIAEAIEVGRREQERLTEEYQRNIKRESDWRLKWSSKPKQ